jgi:hypothetical protein
MNRTQNRITGQAFGNNQILSFSNIDQSRVHPKSRMFTRLSTEEQLHKRTRHQMPDSDYKRHVMAMYILLENLNIIIK